MMTGAGLVKFSPEDGVRLAMRKFPQGVTVVATSHEDKLYGITVSSFTSISLKPPLVMISISKSAPSHIPLSEAEYFTINILASDQIAISERFAGRFEDEGTKFSSVLVLFTSNKCPILNDSIAHLECKRWAVYDGGDHSIIIGEVINVELAREALPLVYYNRQYTTISLPVLAPSSYESLLMEW